MMIDAQEEQAVLEVLRSRRLFRYYGPDEGPSKVAELELAFADRMRARYAVAVTSGTAALICGLQGLEVGPGDEVIVPAYTWIASASAVLAVGAVPVLAEVDETLTLDPEDVTAKITPFTRAIMPVHMRGAPCRMDALMDLARRRGIKVIEDTAQANGGSYRGQTLGAIGDVGCFSLQFNKIITSGEGGVTITDDEDVWKRVLMFHDVASNRGGLLNSDELIWGVNYRMPELLAAVMLVQLRRLDVLLGAMRERKRMLKEGLFDVARRKGVAFRELADPEGDTGCALILFLESPSRAGQVAEALRAENIDTWHLYRPDTADDHVYAHWTSVLEQRTWTPGGGPWRWARRKIEYRPDMCPRTLGLLGRALNLNVSPLLSNQDIEEIIDGLTRVLERLA
jgi:dTDP-4-amino-4,6-dideoxygalactose transaminase